MMRYFPNITSTICLMLMVANFSCHPGDDLTEQKPNTEVALKDEDADDIAPEKPVVIDPVPIVTHPPVVAVEGPFVVPALPFYPTGPFYGSGGGRRPRPAPIEIVEITLDNPSLILVAGSAGKNANSLPPPAQFTITNTSTTLTAENITSHFEGTALENKITETTNTCASVSPGQTCVLGYTPGTVAVPQTEFTISGTNTNPLTASITILPRPAISGLVPNSGPETGGTAVVIQGVGFSGATSVLFDNIPVVPSNVTPTSINVISPPHAPGAVDVVVITPFASTTSPGGFTYQQATTTILVSNSPLLLETNGTPGGLIIINTGAVTASNIVPNLTATALDGTVTVSGNTCATLLPTQSCLISFTPGAIAVAQTSFPISGTNTNIVNAAIEIEPAVTVTSVSPATGLQSGGLPVVINGTGFTSATGVFFGSFSASFVVLNDTTISAITPLSLVAGAVDVTVSTAQGNGTLTNGFVYVSAAQ